MLITSDIDNTNADPETRGHWIALAKSLNIPIRCVLFTASPELCQHNDTVRALNTGPDVRMLCMFLLLCSRIHMQLREFRARERLTEQSQTNPESRTLLPKLAFTSFASRFQEPKVEEGLQDVVRVPFEVRLRPCPGVVLLTIPRRSSKGARN